MKKLILAVFVLIILNGCGHKTEKEKIKEDFEETFGVEIDYDIKIVDKISGNSNKIGECTYDFNKHEGKVVKIKKSWFEEAQFHEKELVLFHEFLHCEGVFVHDDELLDGVAMSIMHHDIGFIKDAYKDNRDYYILEATQKLKRSKIIHRGKTNE